MTEVPIIQKPVHSIANQWTDSFMVGTSVMKELMSQKQILEEPLAPLLIGETFEKLNLQRNMKQIQSAQSKMCMAIQARKCALDKLETLAIRFKKLNFCSTYIIILLQFYFRHSKLRVLHELMAYSLTVVLCFGQGFWSRRKTEKMEN